MEVNHFPRALGTEIVRVFRDLALIRYRWLSLYRCCLTVSTSETTCPWLVSRNRLLKVSASVLPSGVSFTRASPASARSREHTMRATCVLDCAYTLRRQETRGASGTLAPLERLRKEKESRPPVYRPKLIQRLESNSSFGWIFAWSVITTVSLFNYEFLHQFIIVMFSFIKIRDTDSCTL